MQAMRFFKITVELVFFNADDPCGRHTSIQDEQEDHHGECNENADQEARQIHPINFPDRFKQPAISLSKTSV
jgi:hypothetical protein